MKDATEPIVSMYVEGIELFWIGDRHGQGTLWAGVCDALVGPVGVVELFELAQGMEKVPLVPDQCAV
ncbi:hypothetical protein [Saccharopolyspora shandongensis]|uniref:hypothetical protein n=1 Tax=Saccharopolyspora shandongensis TaxID=418495 RepID=UPI0015A73126|nr:hypothetical protein [Saccharopolyspora shandongensis]